MIRIVLDRHHAVDIHEQAAAWREAGGTGYDPGAQPSTTEQGAEERRRYRSTALERSFAEVEPRFRDHYQANYRSTGYPYEHYRPAYEYGWWLRQAERFRGYDWERLEPEARRGWEDRYPGTTWEEIKATGRHAWESFKEEARDVSAGRE